ncbi:MAG: site-specific integrase [Proteobacteria bacterium]|nr:site-specific integrase [Pseudomonadota bacterium]
MTISDTFKGIRNTHGKAQTRKTPIVIDDLRSMVQGLKDDLIGKRDRALLLFGFSGAFRRSELVSLQIEDMAFKREGVEILLRRSKTDQEGKGELIPIPYGSNLETCPVRSIQSWLEASGIKSGFLFRAINKHGHVSQKGMSPASIAFIIKRNAYIKGKEMQFSGHSLRAGFCTQSALSGVASHASMRQARQKKFETHQKYIRIADMWKECAATKLGL